MIPGPFGLIGQSGHYPYLGTVISQPELTGLSKRIPDFMWLACDSATIYPVLIEIEAPSKTWYTKAGKTTEKFNQAHDQLVEWKTWFSKLNHQLLFYELFSIPTSFYKGKTVRPLYVLIYGRRSEFEGNAHLNEKRNQVARQDEFLMTYDRLAPQFNARYFLCSKVISGTYIAKTVPATLELGPDIAPDHALISGKEAAIDRNTLLHEKRRDFLKSRSSYWDNYGLKLNRGVYSTSDKE